MINITRHSRAMVAGAKLATAKTSGISKAFQPVPAEKRFPRISVYELSPESEQGVLAINFVASNYRFLHEIATAIIELGENAVKTSTYIETGRVTIESDKILF